jgi:hypothetical protein
MARVPVPRPYGRLLSEEDRFPKEDLLDILSEI